MWKRVSGFSCSVSFSLEPSFNSFPRDWAPILSLTACNMVQSRWPGPYGKGLLKVTIVGG